MSMDSPISTRLESVAKKHLTVSTATTTSSSTDAKPLPNPPPSNPPNLRQLIGTLSSILATPTEALSSSSSSSSSRPSECLHKTHFDASTLKCSTCATHFDAHERLKKEVAAVDEHWRRAKRELSRFAEKSQTSAQDLIHLHTRIDALDLKANQSHAASKALQNAVLVETGRVLDEVEKRLELQNIRDGLVEEIEGKTQELFEKANHLVADEAKRRYGSQTRVRALEGELDDIKNQLAMERMQLSELRAKMEELRLEKERMEEEESATSSTIAEDSDSRNASPAPTKETDEESIISEYESLNSTTASTAVKSVTDELPTPRPRQSAHPPPQTSSPQPYLPPTEMDAQLLADLHIFLKECTTSKLPKLHTLPFLKTLLEEDVFPALKFGNNPRTNTRKLVDAILINTCFVEEMNATQIHTHQQLHNSLKTALATQTYYSTTKPPPAPGTTPPTGMTITDANALILAQHTATKDSPTHALFAKTYLQTLSSWTSSTPTTLPPQPSSTAARPAATRPSKRHTTSESLKAKQTNGSRYAGGVGTGLWLCATFTTLCGICGWGCIVRVGLWRL
ncbi:hypothetical protein BCR33DRAFT_543946 [Rhizoclosmatium globosum]|uniref:GDP/GTP exchange factor Sec2 N-terminal domain-containing protein n=1 Tax=Rhizoclosmatium globosum TaxID=329046 RepID=A0A1Y2B9L4_9FUNG|nr:hypothetical protein BCR33DRAFT_543946 [Rhizoclosmatium globosum]|eukprot:ORY31513.1 hypothetical protein BCR33DRAFT_543946 [Rhizoclosmatium globosum]